MQIELIDTFLDICETLSFNRTADRLGVTQSTVSGRIRALEKTLGHRLFLRNRGGTQLTTEGLRFEPHARGLRRAWSEAVHATRDAGATAMTLRIGIQHDLAGPRMGDWIREFRAAVPDTAFYVETDYSAQMSRDLVAGVLDLAILFTPRPHPDLHFETLGDIAYRMVSTDTDRLDAVGPDRYILANFSPAFAAAHATLLPGLSTARLTIGQDAGVVGLVLSLGGTAYVLADTAAALVADGRARAVADAPPIAQAVYAGVHLRQRHRGAQRRLLGLLRAHFGQDAPRRTRR